MLKITVNENLLWYNLEAYGWRMASYFLLSVGLILMILFYNVKEITSSSDSYRSKYSFYKIIELIRTKEVWVYIIITICLYIPLPVFADIWSGAMLSQRYDLASSVTADISICTYIGCIIGSLILPTIQNERHTITISLLAAISFILIAIYMELSTISLYVVFFLIGFCAGSVVIAFRSVAKYVDKSSLGLAFGITNTCAMFGLGAINYIIGKAVDYLWNEDLTELGEKLYTSANYQYAITAIVLPVILLGIILSFMKWNIQE